MLKLRKGDDVMIQTTLCYIEENGQYLMLHRTKKKNDVNQDKWIGIGGKFEQDESPYECVVREMKEETGLEPGFLTYRGVITFVCEGAPSEMMHLFHSQGAKGNIREECEEGELCWISKESLLSFNLWEGDKIFLKLLDKDCPFFSLKLVYKNNQLIYHKLDFADGQDYEI